MTLATVGADGRPSTRVVLIKGFDARGIVWYTNYDSRKGRELAAHPLAALQFHWVELERVVRIEGRVEKVERRGVRRLLRQPAARFAHRRLGLAAEPGDRRRAPCWWPRPRKLRRAVRAAPAAAAALGRLPAACPTAGSSGRAARAGCTTGCATACKPAAGCASAWRPERQPERRGLVAVVKHKALHRQGLVSPLSASGAP